VFSFLEVSGLGAEDGIFVYTKVRFDEGQPQEIEDGLLFGEFDILAPGGHDMSCPYRGRIALRPYVGEEAVVLDEIAHAADPLEVGLVPILRAGADEVGPAPALGFGDEEIHLNVERYPPFRPPASGGRPAIEEAFVAGAIATPELFRGNPLRRSVLGQNSEGGTGIAFDADDFDVMNHRFAAANGAGQFDAMAVGAEQLEIAKGEFLGQLERELLGQGGRTAVRHYRGSGKIEGEEEVVHGGK